MSVLRMIETEARGSIHDPNIPISQAFDLLGGEETFTGKKLGTEDLLKATPARASIALIAQSIASMPLDLFRRLDEPSDKERADDHPLHRKLRWQASSSMTAYRFREAQYMNLLVYGDSFSELELRGNGEIKSMRPLPTRSVRIVTEAGEISRYEVTTRTGGTRRVKPERMFHIGSMSPNGIVGWLGADRAKEAIAVYLAMEEFGGRWFSNGAHLETILEVPNVLNDKAYKRLRESFSGVHRGLSNVGTTAILEQGTKVNTISSSPEQSQFLESRKFQAEEVARAFGVPPPLIGLLDRATFNNIHELIQQFYQATILPLLTLYEQEVSRQLLLPRERDLFFAEFNPDVLLRANLKDRFEAYGIAVQSGIFSRNEIRAKENMRPVDGGNEILTPLNMERPGEGERSAKPSTEVRASPSVRREITSAFRGVMESTMGSLLRIEMREVRKAIDRFLRRGEVDDFLNWVEDFYFDRHPELVRGKMSPVFTNFANAIASAAASEAGVEPLEAIRLNAFVEEFTEGFVNRQASRSRGRITDRISSPPEDTDPADAIETTIADWDTARAESIARDEAQQMSNAVARTVFVAGGVISLVWRTVGDSCPLCNELSGKRVGPLGSFVDQGEALNPDGDISPFVPQTKISHPPLHDGCDCIVVPG